jgi:hypothetical protein
MFKPIRLVFCISLCALLYSQFSAYGQNSKQSDVLNYFNFKGQPTPSKELHTMLERQARWDIAGTGDQALTEARFNPLGLRLRFEKIDEPAKQGERVSARYRVFAEGAPENKVFVLDAWLVNNTSSTDPRDIFVNGQGLLMVHPPKPEQETSLQAGDDEFDIQPVTVSAEPIRYLLTSRDNQLSIYGTLVPHPAVSEDQECRLEVRLAQPNATAVLIIADRFPAKARIPLVLESEGLSTTQTLITDTNGHAVMAVFPYVPGVAQGKLKVSAEGPKCLAYVVLPWGAEPHPAPKTPQR